MAQIQDELILGIDQALNQINQLERALDRAIAPIEIEVDATEAEALESTLREIERIAERASTETSAMALAAGRAEVNFEDVARALNISEDAARDMTREILDAQAAANRLEDASRDVARQLGLSESEANRLVRSLKEADTAAASVNVRSGALAGSFGTLRIAAAGIASAFAAIGIGQGLALAARGAVAAVNQFQALNESVNAVKVTFETGSDTIFKFGEISAQVAGLSAQAFQQAVVPIGAVLRNFGFDATEAADASVVLVQRAADLASVFNTDVAEALTAINSALVGQVEPLRRFGAEISVARVEAFALSSGLAASKADIDNVILTQARLGLILQDTNRAAGDFVNTADEFANASRIAKADVDELAASAGEALLPAFEALLGMVPELVDGLETGLVPVLADVAAQISVLVTSIGEGAGDSFADETVIAITTLGTAFDALKVPIDAAAFATGVFFGNFGQAGEAIDQFTQRIDNQIIRGSLVRMISRMQEGVKAADAFTDEIVQIGDSASALDLLEQGFTRMVGTSGLAGLELETTIRALIVTGEESDFTAEALRFLNDQLEILANTLHPVGNEAGQAAIAMTFFADSLPQAASRFVTFGGDVESASVRAAAALAELATAAEAQQARTAAAFDLFAELPDDIEGSFTAAVDTLREQVEAAFDFDVNIALLRSLDLDALADDFERQGLAAAGQLEQAVGDIPLAIEADALLQGVGDLGEEAFDALVQRFVDAEITPAEAKRLAETLTSPTVIAAAEEAAGIVAVKQGESYHSRLTEEFDQLIPETGTLIGGLVSEHWSLGAEADTAAAATAQSYVDGIIGFNIDDRIQEIFDSVSFVVDFFDAGAESAATYAHGFQEELASRQDDITGSITEAIDSAIQRESPPKLFLDAGKDSAEAFALGFDQAGLTLRKPELGVTGTATSAVSGAAGGGGIHVELTTINPTQQDEVSDVARMGQIASSIAASYRSVVPNGM